jgi:5-methylcytosine-specific restriction protein A
VDRNPSGNVFDKSYLLCWNPTRWEWPDFETVVQRSIKGEPIAEPWSTGNTKAISEGQRVYLYRQAIERGIIGSGWTTSDTYMDDHWDGSGKKIPYAKVVFDRIVAPEDVLPVEGLIRRFPNFNWNRLQSSGISLPSDVASRLEALWQEHLKGLGFRIEPNEVAMPALYVEGATRSVTVNAYERNPRARKACLDHYGFDCAVCVFNFANFYGDLGEGFIHVHHLKDLATVGGEYEVDPIADLRPVCPNCHAMLHAETPAMSIAKLRSIIDARRT